ncbi:MAG: hypothetical protein O6949_01355 [Chloroflexi bacterium]|nr:hypothetical protein [Chloroflexota bacterium]
MTPQSPFMILAPIEPSREAELRLLLDSMNEAPGRVNPNNELLPFAQFDALHFARLLILDDKTTQDVLEHGVLIRTYPLYFALLGDVDGDENVFLDELVGRSPEGLRTLFSCCEGFEPDTDLLAWMKRHRSPPIANYINTRGRTVVRVREEAALREALEAHIASNAASLQGCSPGEIHDTLRTFVEAETSAGRLTLSDEARTPLKWWIGNVLHLLGMPLLLLLVSPLLVFLLPFYVLILRHLEKTDPEVTPTVDQEYSDDLSRLEDHDVTNQFSAMGSLKPGFVRLLTIFGVLLTVDYAARHIVWAGLLGRIRSIHFARWVFVAGTERVIFLSNYDGSLDSYMDDFINKTGFGLNAVFGSGLGYPTTNWLIRDGSADERKYKEYLRRHTIPTQVWYKAYPGLTAIDLARNDRIRKGLKASNVSDQEAREWVALL